MGCANIAEQPCDAASAARLHEQRPRIRTLLSFGVARHHQSPGAPLKPHAAARARPNLDERALDSSHRKDLATACQGMTPLEEADGREERARGLAAAEQD